jgi:hypothetical protein
MDQIIIFSLGCTGIWFMSKGTPRGALVGSVLGLSSEPFWFWSSYKASQWGIMVMACVYSAVFAKAIWKHRRAFTKES